MAAKVICLNPVTRPTRQDATQSFLVLKRAQGVAPATLHDYDKHLGLFFKKHPGSWPDDLQAAIFTYMSPFEPDSSKWACQLIVLSSSSSTARRDFFLAIGTPPYFGC